MKLHQLRYLAATVQNGLNITAAAKKLHTSQPGVSKQLKLLEDELGFPLFERDGRNLSGLTPAGQEVVDRTLRILEEVQNIRRLSAEHLDEKSGSLSIGTTHTQARYMLPPLVAQFRKVYPEVDLHLHQGTTEQIADMAAADRIDFAIATGGEEQFPNLVLLPVYRWHRRIVVPRDHPLASVKQLTLKAIAQYPIVTYVFSFSGRSSLPALFEAQGLKLNVSLTARDADVIKTYVRLGLGIGIALMVAPFLVAVRNPDPEKVSAYECGFNPFNDSRMKFDVRFYLVAILFIIFDLEIAFLFPWAVSLDTLGTFGLATMGIFLGVLVVGFIYEWKKGALEWD